MPRPHRNASVQQGCCATDAERECWEQSVAIETRTDGATEGNS